MFHKLLLAVVFAVFSTSANAESTTRRFLLDTLGSRTALSLKISAIKSLKEEVSNADVSRSLFNILVNTKAASLARQEALKSLVPVTRSSNITRKLTTLFHREKDLAVKTVLVKSLWLAAAGNNRVRRFLTSVLYNSPEDELKSAAAFALQATMTSSLAARPLLNVARNTGNATEVRVEALKSLFFYNNSSVDRSFQQLASDESEDTEVRIASLKLLIGYPISNTKRRFLMNLSQTSADEMVRVAAIDALRVNLNQDDIRYFHLFKNPKTGELRDPLLD
jgi:hypothetical protein